MLAIDCEKLAVLTVPSKLINNITELFYIGSTCYGTLYTSIYNVLGGRKTDQFISN